MQCGKLHTSAEGVVLGPKQAVGSPHVLLQLTGLCSAAAACACVCSTPCPSQFMTPALPTRTRFNGLLKRFSATVARLSPIILPVGRRTASGQAGRHRVLVICVQKLLSMASISCRQLVDRAVWSSKTRSGILERHCNSTHTHTHTHTHTTTAWQQGHLSSSTRHVLCRLLAERAR